MNEQRPRRPMRLKEAFGVECWNCKQDIEVPCEPPHKCPHCGVLLEIELREREIPRPKVGGRSKSLPIQSR
jgi:rRNA maturation endonuclease Nob1